MIERRGNFGAGTLDVTFRHLTWIWNHLENFTGTLDKAVFVMAYLRDFLENIGEEHQKSEVELGSLTEYGIVSEYINHPRGDAVARPTITDERASAEWKRINPSQGSPRFPEDRHRT